MIQYCRAAHLSYFGALGLSAASGRGTRACMRTTFDSATVRLYHLDAAGDGGTVTTLFYGPLSEALAMAAGQPEDIQADLYLATENDVVAYLDMDG